MGPTKDEGHPLTPGTPPWRWSVRTCRLRHWRPTFPVLTTVPRCRPEVHGGPGPTNRPERPPPVVRVDPPSLPSVPVRGSLGADSKGSRPHSRCPRTETDSVAVPSDPLPVCDREGGETGPLEVFKGSRCDGFRREDHETDVSPGRRRDGSETGGRAVGPILWVSRVSVWSGFRPPPVTHGTWVEGNPGFPGRRTFVVYPLSSLSLFHSVFRGVVVSLGVPALVSSSTVPLVRGPGRVMMGSQRVGEPASPTVVRPDPLPPSRPPPEGHTRIVVCLFHGRRELSVALGTPIVH